MEESEVGDEGFYLQETEQSQAYSEYSVIKSYENLGYTLDELLDITGFDKAKHDSLKSRFEITEDPD